MAQEKKHDGSSTRDFKSSMRTGALYLGMSVAVIILLYVLPTTSGIDLANLARSATSIAILRIALGAAMLALVGSRFIGLLRASTLEGETLMRGMRNLVHSPILQAGMGAIMLLTASGIILIVLGASAFL